MPDEKKPEAKGASEKLVAFVLPEKYSAVVGTAEPQVFSGTAPGIWSLGVPVTPAELDPSLTAEQMRALIKEHNLPLEEVKVAADYAPKEGHSQHELMNRGLGDHALAGPSEDQIEIAKRAAAAEGDA